MPPAPDPHNEHNESNFMRSAEREVKSLVKAARWSKFYIRILAVVAAVLVAVACVLGVVINSQGGIIGSVRNGAVTSCQDGNKYRAQQTQIWNRFVDLLLKQRTPNPVTQQIGATFKEYVADVNAPRDCSRVYQLNLPASSAPAPSAPSPG